MSTLLEAERVLSLLQSYQAQRGPVGRPVNVLYGFPLYAAAVPRLAAVARTLGPGCVSVLADHPSQVAVAQQLAREATTAIDVYVKVDLGDARAGVRLGSPECTAVIRELLQLGAEKGYQEGVVFRGLYCHAGHSYDARQPWAAMAHLVDEYMALGAVASEVRRAAATEGPLPRLVLSVGASPTAATLQHPSLGGEPGTDIDAVAVSDDSSKNVAALRATLHELEAQGYELEVHAGVQPVLDLQQLATHSWGGGAGSTTSAASNETDDLALTILADVASVYPGRGGAGGTAQSDELLINAGCLALGREPVKNVEPGGGGSGTAAVYSGWGIVKPWLGVGKEAGGAECEKSSRIAVSGADFPRLPAADGDKGWWQVARISQEHGILSWVGGPCAQDLVPSLGQRLRIWPNHACIAGAGFGNYLIVDSTSEDPDKIVDVWERWNGW